MNNSIYATKAYFPFSLGRNTAMELGKNANAIVRMGKRVLYDRRKVDKWIDEQAQDRYVNLPNVLVSLLA